MSLRSFLCGGPEERHARAWKYLAGQHRRDHHRCVRELEASHMTADALQKQVQDLQHSLLGSECMQRSYSERFFELERELAEHNASCLRAAKVAHERARELEERVETLQASVDQGYQERNRLVAYLAHMWPSGVRPTAIDGWDAEWHGCVWIDTPEGQMSWHYHDRDAGLFADLPAYSAPWDGHSTPEKYERLARLQEWKPKR